MKKIIARIAKRLFGAEVEFRVKLFNLIGLTGVASGLITAIGNLLTAGDPPSQLYTNISMAAVCVAVVWYCNKSGKYMFGYLFLLVVYFLTAMPALFFLHGGYKSAYPLTFLTAIVLTVIMLRGWLMVIFCVLEGVVYSSVILVAYYYPHTVTPLGSDGLIISDIVTGLLFYGTILVAALGLLIRIYDRDRRELIAARDRIAELSRLHHGVFTQMSHEMRTPLTVMSASAQYAVKQIERGTMDVNTITDLKSISGEAKRLSELADNALNALAGGSGKDDSQIVLTSVDIVSLCKNVITLMSHIPQSQRPNITLDAGENIGEVQGDNRLLTQLVYNFLANAATHSGCTEIVVRVRKDNAECGMRNAELTSTSTSKEKSLGGYVEIAVEDNGKGISPELLPRVFESGVSGEGSTGMGLHLCQEIAEKHGAKISVDSEVGRGTRMSVRLRG